MAILSILRPEIVLQLLTTTTGNCDSIIHLSLQVVDMLETFLDSSICSGDAVVIGSNTYMDPGNYQVALISSSGCDRTVYLALQVHPVYDLIVHDTICEGESVVIGNSTYHRRLYHPSCCTGSGCDGVDSFVSYCRRSQYHLSDRYTLYG